MPLGATGERGEAAVVDSSVVVVDEVGIESSPLAQPASARSAPAATDERSSFVMGR